MGLKDFVGVELSMATERTFKHWNFLDVNVVLLGQMKEVGLLMRQHKTAFDAFSITICVVSEERLRVTQHNTAMITFRNLFDR